MPNIEGYTNYTPEKDIPSLEGKVIFITGGTAGLGAESAKHFAVHNPAHIYISGRSREKGEALINEIKYKNPKTEMTFVQMDLGSMAAVKAAVKEHFKHDRLDILMCNAGIMAQPAALSKDGYEIQFATNHLGHAMLTECLLPTLLRTAKMPGSDVRILMLTSEGYGLHPGCGISFEELDSGSAMKRLVFGSWLRYGHSKLANILYASELARRYPQITSVSIHPGVVLTDLYYTQAWYNRWFIAFSSYLLYGKSLEPHQGAYSQTWCAAAAKKEELVNGSMYRPVGRESWNWLDKTARDEKLAKQLYDWTEGVLAKF